MEQWRREMYETELYHYGILGMKWGVRRYQNPDGSLTPAGREHYNQKLTRTNEKLAKAQSRKPKLDNRVTQAKSKADQKTAKVKDLESRLIFKTKLTTWMAKRGEAKALKALSKAEKMKFKNDKQIDKLTKKGQDITDKYLSKPVKEADLSHLTDKQVEKRARNYENAARSANQSLLLKNSKLAKKRQEQADAYKAEKEYRSKLKASKDAIEWAKHKKEQNKLDSYYDTPGGWDKEIKRLEKEYDDLVNRRTEEPEKKKRRR